MPLRDLGNELLLCILENLELEGDINQATAFTISWIDISIATIYDDLEVQGYYGPQTTDEKQPFKSL